MLLPHPLDHPAGRRRRLLAPLAVVPLVAVLVGLTTVPAGLAGPTTPSGLPVADFRAVMGYAPERVAGRPDVLVSPRGECSVPTGGTPFGFDDACREHDLAYDVLRYRAIRDLPVDPRDRFAADARFGLRMAEGCVDEAAAVVVGCLGTATFYSAGVAVNSVRQAYGPPAAESGAQVAGSVAGMLALLALPLLPVAVARAFRRVLHRAELGLPRPLPTSGWSGSAGSLVAWADVGREGRRLLAGTPVAPGAIRVFVGLECARRLPERVEIAVTEALRVGAFTRGTVCVAAPTGSGWLNPAAVEGLERATGGDVATIAVQYAAAPSWLAAVAHPGAHRRTAEALLAAVHERWAALDPADRPRLVVLGESLGANAVADALRALPHAAADVDGGLLVGGIGSAAWEPSAVAGGRVALVRHDDDPVVHLSGRPRPAVLRALPSAGGAPEGHGHHYGRELGAAWRANLTPSRPVRRWRHPGPATV